MSDKNILRIESATGAVRAIRQDHSVAGGHLNPPIQNFKNRTHRPVWKGVRPSRRGFLDAVQGILPRVDPRLNLSIEYLAEPSFGNADFSESH